MTEKEYSDEIRRQATIDAEDAAASPAWHQNVGTVIPFSKTVDRDPNPRIPLSVPVPYVSISKREALFWVVVIGLWLGYLFFGPGSW